MLLACPRCEAVSRGPVAGEGWIPQPWSPSCHCPRSPLLLPNPVALESICERHASGVAAGRKSAPLSLFAFLGANKKYSLNHSENASPFSVQV